MDRKENIEIANSFYQNGEFERAIDFYSRAIEQNPEDSEALEGRGLCYYSLLRIEEAISDLGSAIEVDPNNHDVLFNRGVIWIEKKEYPKAKDDIEKAIEIYGESIEYYTCIIYVNEKLAKHEETIRYSKKLLTFDPDNDAGINALANAYFETERPEKAMNLYLEIIRRHPQSAFAYNNVGFGLSNIGRHKEAIPYFNTAIKLDSHCAYAYDNRGFCKSKLGDSTGGMKDVNKSLEIDPSNAYAYKNKGIIHMASLEDGMALECFEKAEALGYSEKYDDEVRKLVEQISGA